MKHDEEDDYPEISHWNHRVCKGIYRKGTEFEEVFYEVSEVYYDKDGNESSWIVPMTLKGCTGDSVEDLKESYALLMSAFDKPVFEYPEDDE